jgi:hypothetical protein
MRAALIACLALAVAPRARAQLIETPVPFDSAHRVLAVTPILAERLRLAEPVWPVRGDYRDARLYSLSLGGYVLVALLPNGALQRYELTDAQRTALGSAIDLAMASAGHPTAPAGSEVSEPAGNGYARHVGLLSAAVYAPLAASLFDDGSAAGAAYVLTTGGAFFISYSAAQNGQITRAQGDLSANLGLAAGAAGLGLGYVASGNGDRGVRGLALGSAVVGTIAGVGLGHGLTEAEAHAAFVGIEGAGASTWAIAAGAGASRRTTAGLIVASEPIGYLLGVRYPRVSSYAVTAGDLNAMQTSALVGGVVGAALISNGGGASDRQVGAAVGAGYIGGLLVGDAAIARPFDLTNADANLVTVGAVAGGVMGLAVPLAAQSDNAALIFGSVAGGAVLGMSVIFASTDFHQVGQRQGAVDRGGGRLQIEPGALLGLATRTPGRYPLVHFSF